MTHLKIYLQRVFLLAFSVSHLPQVSPGEQLHRYTPFSAEVIGTFRFQLTFDMAVHHIAGYPVCFLYDTQSGGRTSWALSLVAIFAGYATLRVKTSWKGVAHEYYGSRVSESRQSDLLTVLPYLLLQFCVLYERYCVNSAKHNINSRWTSRWFCWIPLVSAQQHQIAAVR